MVCILYFLHNLLKYSSISLILSNWSILIGDLISDNKIPESTILRSLFINAYHNFLTQGSTPNIILHINNKDYCTVSGHFDESNEEKSMPLYKISRHTRNDVLK